MPSSSFMETVARILRLNGPKANAFFSPRLPFQDEFFKTWLVTHTPNKSNQPENWCSVCGKFESPTGSKHTELERIVSCNHLVHYSCMVFWATRTHKWVDSCPRCSRRLFIHAPSESYMLASEAGIEVEPHPLPNGRVQYGKYLVDTEEEQYKAEYSTLQTLVDDAVTRQVNLARMMHAIDQDRWVAIVHEVIELFKAQGMPQSQYLPNDYRVLDVAVTWLVQKELEKYPEMRNTTALLLLVQHQREVDWVGKKPDIVEEKEERPSFFARFLSRGREKNAEKLAEEGRSAEA